MKCGLVCISAIALWGILPACLLRGEGAYQINPISIPLGTKPAILYDINNAGSMVGAVSSGGMDLSVVFQLGGQPATVSPIPGDYQGTLLNINSSGVGVGTSDGSECPFH